MKIWLPADPSRRALLVALVCSVLLHVLVAASVYMAGAYAPKIVAKRGEPLFVDIAPDRPEERAPRGNPARPGGPDQAPPPWRGPPPPPPAAPGAPAAAPPGAGPRPRPSGAAAGARESRSPAPEGRARPPRGD